MIEKEFLENIEYLTDLSERVKKSKKISPKLLSEIVCAKSYIDSLSFNSMDKYKLSEVSNIFDIIIADSRKIEHKSFNNPCAIEVERIFSDDDFKMIKDVLLLICGFILTGVILICAMKLAL